MHHPHTRQVAQTISSLYINHDRSAIATAVKPLTLPRAFALAAPVNDDGEAPVGGAAVVPTPPAPPAPEELLLPPLPPVAVLDGIMDPKEPDMESEVGDVAPVLVA